MRRAGYAAAKLLMGLIGIAASVAVASLAAAVDLSWVWQYAAGTVAYAAAVGSLGWAIGWDPVDTVEAATRALWTAVAALGRAVAGLLMLLATIALTVFTPAPQSAYAKTI
jgi:hypothetical protein